LLIAFFTHFCSLVLFLTLLEEVCEFLSLKDSSAGLDIAGLNITNIPPELLAKGSNSLLLT
jgi:hypothetical protein